MLKKKKGKKKQQGHLHSEGIAMGSIQLSRAQMFDSVLCSPAIHRLLMFLSFHNDSCIPWNL